MSAPSPDARLIFLQWQLARMPIEEYHWLINTVRVYTRFSLRRTALLRKIDGSPSCFSMTFHATGMDEDRAGSPVPTESLVADFLRPHLDRIPHQGETVLVRASALRLHRQSNTGVTFTLFFRYVEGACQGTL